MKRNIFLLFFLLNLSTPYSIAMEPEDADIEIEKVSDIEENLLLRQSTMNVSSCIFTPSGYVFHMTVEKIYGSAIVTKRSREELIPLEYHPYKPITKNSKHRRIHKKHTFSFSAKEKCLKKRSYYTSF